MRTHATLHGLAAWTTVLALGFGVGVAQPPPAGSGFGQDRGNPTPVQTAPAPRQQSSPSKDGSAQGRVLEEFWEAVHLEGSPVGHAHALFQSFRVGQQELIEARTELDLI